MGDVTRMNLLAASPRHQHSSSPVVQQVRNTALHALVGCYRHRRLTRRRKKVHGITHDAHAAIARVVMCHVHAITCTAVCFYEPLDVIAVVDRHLARMKSRECGAAATGGCAPCGRSHSRATSGFDQLSQPFERSTDGDLSWRRLVRARPLIRVDVAFSCS